MKMVYEVSTESGYTGEVRVEKFTTKKAALEAAKYGGEYDTVIYRSYYAA